MHLHMAPALCLPTLDFSIYRKILVKDEAASFVHLRKPFHWFPSLYFSFFSLLSVPHLLNKYFQFLTPNTSSEEKLPNPFI